jgi:hypothetical protein
MLQPLYSQEKSPWCPLDRRLSVPQNRSGHGDENKNSQPLLGLELMVIQPIAQHSSYFHNQKSYIKSEK